MICSCGDFSGDANVVSLGTTPGEPCLKHALYIDKLCIFLSCVVPLRTLVVKKGIWHLLSTCDICHVPGTSPGTLHISSYLSLTILQPVNSYLFFETVLDMQWAILGYGMNRMNTTDIIQTSWELYFSREACLSRLVWSIENERSERPSKLARVTQLVRDRRQDKLTRHFSSTEPEVLGHFGLRAPLYFQEVLKTHKALLFIWVKSVNTYRVRNYTRAGHRLRTAAPNRPTSSTTALRFRALICLNDSYSHKVSSYRILQP